MSSPYTSEDSPARLKASNVVQKSLSPSFPLWLSIFSRDVPSRFLASVSCAVCVSRFPKGISPGGQRKKVLSSATAFAWSEKAAHGLSRRQQ